MKGRDAGPLLAIAKLRVQGLEAELAGLLGRTRALDAKIAAATSPANAAQHSLTEAANCAKWQKLRRDQARRLLEESARLRAQRLQLEAELARRCGELQALSSIVARANRETARKRAGRQKEALVQTWLDTPPGITSPGGRCR